MTAGAPKMSERSQRARARAEASQSGTQEDAQAKGKRIATQSRGEGSQGDKKKPRRECPMDKQTQTDATADAAPQPEPSHYECPICMDLLIAPVVCKQAFFPAPKGSGLLYLAVVDAPPVSGASVTIPDKHKLVLLCSALRP